MSLYMHRQIISVLEPLDGTIGGYKCFLPINEDTIIAKIELDENLLFFAEAIKLFKSVCKAKKSIVEDEAKAKSTKGRPATKFPGVALGL